MRLPSALAMSFVAHGIGLIVSSPLPEQAVATAPLVVQLHSSEQRLQRPTPSVAAEWTALREEVRRIEEPAAVRTEVASIAAPIAPVTSEGLNAEGLRQFHVALARQASRFRQYPPQAVASGWKGVVDIRLIFQSTGSSAAEVVRTSGIQILDEAALDMLRQAASVTVMPESLRGRDFAVNLPVMFD